MNIRQLSLKEVEYTAFEMARKFMTWDEPIPDFGTRYPNVLESCIATPFQTYNRKPLYKKLVGKGAILFYLIVKNHPFENGNKRIAVMALLVFLYLNRKWLNVSNAMLYEFAVMVAESHPKSKDKNLANIEMFLTENIVDFQPEDRGE
jgi:death-on-curing family protein